MPGFLKATLSVSQAVELSSKFTFISIDDLLTPNHDTPRLSKVNAKLLYIAQPQKKLSYSKVTKGFHQARKLELEKYHRFVVLGVPGTATVFCMFTQNSEESRRLLRYQKSIRPGTDVLVLKPYLEGQLGGGATPLVTTREPLVPTAEISTLTSLPPFDVEGTSLEYRFFSFNTRNLAVDSAVIAENVCDGAICDGRSYHEPCGCIEASSKKTWALLIDFTCPELHGLDDTVSVYSVSLAAVFLTSNMRNIQPDSEKLDRFQLDEKVQVLVQAINDHQGFRVEGWFKPAADEEGTAVGNKKYHISSLRPETSLTMDQQALQYAGEPTAPTTSGSNAPPTPETTPGVTPPAAPATPGVTPPAAPATPGQTTSGWLGFIELLTVLVDFTNYCPALSGLSNDCPDWNLN